MAKKKVKLSDPAGGIAKGAGEVPGWICPNCGKLKPLEDFGLRQIQPDKHIKQSWCKDCR